MPEKINGQRLREKVIGSIMGVAIGDALGLPLECKSPHIIRELFGYVDTYVPNTLHKFKEVSRRAAGTFSDDTQLTLALADSLERTGGYSLPDIAKAYTEAYDGKWGKKLGWGGTTRKAVENIKQGIKPTAIPEGAGNGPPMKITPLAVYCVYKCSVTSHHKFTNSFNAALLKKCKEISLITHGDPRCIVASYCQTRMIIRALQDELPEFTRQIAALFIEDAKYAESKLNFTADHSVMLSRRLEEFLTTYYFTKSTSVVSTNICTEQSSFILNSYPMVAYCASKYIPYKNFQHAVLQTINAGADADSNGAMVGTIVAADLGWNALPIDLIHGLKQWKMVLKQAKKFEMSL